MRRTVLLSLIICAGAMLIHAAEDDYSVTRARIVADWMIQDSGEKNPGKCFTDKQGFGLEEKMMKAVLAETKSRSHQSKLDKLVNAKTPGVEQQWKDLYIDACEERREARLQNLFKTTKQIVFTKHYTMGGSHYAYTEGLSDAQAERHFKPGTALCMLTVSSPYPKVTNLIDDPKGVIRDPDVSYDGKRVLFSWKKSDREDDYHLYEMDLATKEIRQLTFGLGFADYEGCYLPNDDIIFNSTRCVSIVDCWWTEVSNLYTCDKDGKFLRRLGFDQVHSNYPQVLPDGRVVYTRWDYNDRGQLYPQPLFQMNYDGTGQTEYYGNNSWWPTTVGHARGIPNSDKIIAIATGHHSRQMGALIRIDVKQGNQENTGATLVAPLVEDKKDRRYRRVDGYTGFDGHFQYPYPINEKEYVASYSATETGNRLNGYDLIYVNEAAGREVLAHDPKISCNQPVFVIKRPLPQLRPTTVDYTKKTGTYFMQDVYFGPGLKDIPRGTVKKLRVVSLDFRAAGVGRNGNRGPGGGALVSTPISINNGAWDVKAVIGEAKVYEDGSAFFEVPARTPLYFQCIDADGYVVQTMRSWSTLMPGENFSCIGCHEPKDATPPTNTKGSVMAMKAGAQKLTPFYSPAKGFSFPKLVQPILDKHCIKCHDGGEKKPFSLAGETKTKSGGRNWSHSYMAFTQGGKPNDVVKWMNVQSIPPMLPPYFAGSSQSKLPKILKSGDMPGKKGAIKLTQNEIDIISCWIDLLVPYCGDYYEANSWSEKEVQKYDKFVAKRKAMEDIESQNIAEFIKKRQ